MEVVEEVEVGVGSGVEGAPREAAEGDFVGEEEEVTEGVEEEEEEGATGEVGEEGGGEGVEEGGTEEEEEEGVVQIVTGEWSVEMTPLI